MNTKNIVLIVCALIAIGCSNSDTDFEDFDVIATYFPYQTPARTLILGKYDQGFNDGDNNHNFEITAVMTGVRSNGKDRSIYFEVDNSLLDNVKNVKALPPAYYTMENISPVTIPSGDTKARIKVQLREAFFNDPLSFGAQNTTNYVIPLRITKADNIDSILVGRNVIDNPDRVNPADWDVLPKDYTLFGIKYMNKFHGHYLRRGEDMITNPMTAVGRTYSSEYVVDDEVVLVETTGFNKVKVQNLVGRDDLPNPGEIPQGIVTMELTFTDDGTCTISSFGSDPYGVTGSGEYVEEGDAWGGKSRDVIYLDYTYLDPDFSETHTVKDTLVIRDRAAVLEQFEVELR
ncbi:DUF5627 domain-containing protein [Tamlana sp. 2_MG-2023]|uniref:DUF5627 domain-containing protein n=1 Tax=unclassified Tamlana TaxID=2614803 RepID=UPI0026E1FE9C|nr:MULTISPECIES: DUF5627 domain-containing protein [unclassified Tamlana]MDO6759983.1 DUF5627 domain-containing protein [Tamlana sp. 2_MG-2023]MDO6791847.1 DUF5627 domain-containing protein [Tamlana sp. 1_MG-2023]